MARVRSNAAVRRVYSVAVLGGFCLAGWLAVTRDFHPWSLTGATVFSVLSAVFAAPVFFEENPLDAVRMRWRLDLMVLVFLTWLAEGYMASLEIIVRMFTRRYRPGIVRIRTRLASRLGRVLLANAITLVPGTLSLWLQDRHLFVHWFDVKSDHSIRAGDLIKRRLETYLGRLFG